MIPSVWLYGSVGEGRRKKILGMTLQAKSVSEIPEASGVLMVSGEDFVQEENRNLLLQWIRQPGRLALVVPPLPPDSHEIPLRWKAQYAEASVEGNTGLAAFLAEEVQYRLYGDFLTDRIRNLQFAGETLTVGYYRPRIATGVLAVTILPIWSLRTVDQPKLVQDWIAQLYELSGRPPETGAEDQQDPALTPLHFSMLLHLAGRQYGTMDAALDSLGNSPVFKISREQGIRLFNDLRQVGYIEKTSLSESGREALSKSPYSIYLNALKEENP